MFNSQFLLLCFVAGSYATDNLVPFIDKCVWSDKACLKKSTEKALPFVAKGLPELGVKSMDPMEISKANLVDGELKIDFSKMTVTGAANAKILKVERDINANKLKLAAECPINVVGDYEAHPGKIFLADIQGKGPFQVNCKLIYIEVEVDLTKVEKDGVMYWNIGDHTLSYEAKEKCTINLENLFNGDKALAEPVLGILNGNWKDLLETTCKPIVKQIVNGIVGNVKTMCGKIPANQLEKE